MKAGWIAAAFMLWIGCQQAERQGSKVLQKEEAMRTDSMYLETGQKIVATTFDTLRKSLIDAIGVSGPEGAVAYCQIHAYPLTAAYEQSYQVQVKRTTLKYRNEQNRPTDLEAGILQQWEQKKLEGEAIEPFLYREESLVHYFQPIVVAPFCLTCHGKTGTDISVATSTVLKKKYPDDMATGYTAGDLRGMWHVTFTE